MRLCCVRESRIVLQLFFSNKKNIHEQLGVCRNSHNKRFVLRRQQPCTEVRCCLIVHVSCHYLFSLIISLVLLSAGMCSKMTFSPLRIYVVVLLRSSRLVVVD